MSNLNLALNVFYKDKKIGLLKLNNGILDLELNNDISPLDISPNFNKNDDSLDFSLKLKKYLSNIIPEGKALENMLLKNKIVEDKNGNFYFELLDLLNNDVSGAFYFSKDETLDLELEDKSDIVEITEKDLLSKINEEVECKGSFAIWNEKERLSVAGFQPKLNIIYNNDSGKMFLPSKNRHSTHILKIDNQENDNIILNELFCLKLSSKCNFKRKIECELLRFKKLQEQDFDSDLINNFDDGESYENCLLIKRFDREINNDLKVSKIHVIDGAILLNKFNYEKYQRSVVDSSSLKSLSEKLEGLNIEKDEKEEFIKILIFNLIINNYDYHLKNISFFYEKDSIAICPIYDTVNVSIYPSYSNKFSMFIGEAKNKKELSFYDLFLLSSDLNVSFKQLNVLFNIMKNEILSVLDNSDNFYDFIQNDLTSVSKKDKVFDFTEDEMDFFQDLKNNILSSIRTLTLLFNEALINEKIMSKINKDKEIKLET